MSGFPLIRCRRSRQAHWSRRLVAEHQLSVDDLVLPIFVHEQTGSSEIPGFRGVQRHSIDAVCHLVEKAVELGIPSVALFPVVPVEKKCHHAQEALREDNLVCRAISALKKRGFPCGIIADVALDPYTIHGHDGLLREGYVDNDSTVEQLCLQSQVLLAAGADVLAPSDMMDGRVKALRNTCEEMGYSRAIILSYAAKYASSFYSPFRVAVGSDCSLAQGDKRSYQQDPANSDEAIRECLLDIQEGADWLMIKPGMPYLDIILRITNSVQVPVLAYQVSGEYVMLDQLARQSNQSLEKLQYESLLAFKRAGAAAVFTYAALSMASWLSQTEPV